jgi:hypothetical protein
LVSWQLLLAKTYICILPQSWQGLQQPALLFQKFLWRGKQNRSWNIHFRFLPFHGPSQEMGWYLLDQISQCGEGVTQDFQFSGKSGPLYPKRMLLHHGLVVAL